MPRTHLPPLAAALLVFATAACSSCDHNRTQTSAAPGPSASSAAPIASAPASAGSSDAPVAPPPVADGGVTPPISASTPVTGHPRLWFRAEDIPRLRAWAVDSNPMWSKGLAPLAATAKKDMDDGKVPNDKGCNKSQNFCEQYAQLFAFLSLVHPDAAQRADYQKRAKTILMNMMPRFDKCPSDDRLCVKTLVVYNRSEWAGESFSTTVDWIYPALTADDKKVIRSVMLKWAETLLHATVTGANHPEPVGVLNDAKLLQHKVGVRYGSNNYFVAHMRNLAYNAIALDDADDPAEPDAKRQYPRLRDYLKNATGAWLYRTDAALRGDAAGGAPVEGAQYGPETLAFIAQTHLALLTAGELDPQKHGPQVVMENNPFWQDHPKAFAHMMSPVAKVFSGWDGPHYSPVWYGDGQSYEVLDFIDSFAALGLYAQYTGNKDLLNAARWYQIYMAPGGKELLYKRANAENGGMNFRHSIFYFLLFDPKAPPPTDPRPAMPLDHFAPGLGQLFSRTSWKEDAAWFHYMIGWENIDHRHGDANHFDFWRKGEWLTKERMGYGEVFQLSDQHNTLTIENDKPQHMGETRKIKWERGSQWVIHHHEDPKLVAHSFAPAYTYGLGDATGVYNASGEGLVDVKHASRSILWVKPDHVIVYDRATTGKDDRKKLYWLQTQDVAVVNGNKATSDTKNNQQLVLTCLLPAQVTIHAEEYKGEKYPFKRVAGEPMKGTLFIEPAKMDKDLRFLTVLQGIDKGTVADSPALVTSSGGQKFAGAVVKDIVAMFPVDVTGGPSKETTFQVPESVKRHFVTGLTPNAEYAVQTSKKGDKDEIVVKDGSGQKADDGGVLMF